MGPLRSPCLAFVTDRHRTRERPFEDVVDAAVSGGVDLVQLREKDLSDSELLLFARSLKNIIHDQALFFVNGNVDVALAVKADGVHLGENDPAIDAVRAEVNDRLLIGRSVHSVRAALEAEHLGADLLIAGTVFESDSHPLETAQGIGLIEHIVKVSKVPVLGIGGVNPNNVKSILSAGASGCAVITAISQAKGPRQAANDLKTTMLSAQAKVS